MRRGLYGIVLTVLLVSTAEVAFHAYAAAGGTPLARRLGDAYYYRDPDNHKPYVAGVVDLLVPAIGFGIALGIFGSTWPVRYLVFGALSLSLCVVALVPLYATWLPGGHSWPNSKSPRAPDYVVSYMKALALCGVFTHGARLLTRHLRHGVETERTVARR